MAVRKMNNAGMLSTPQQSNSPQKIMKSTIKAALPQFTNALPAAIKPERFQSMVLTAVNKTPKLLECDPFSVVAAALQSAQLGLEPNTPLGQAYLIPYWDSKTKRMICNFQPGYRGLITLAFRSGELLSIDAQEVYEADDFDFELGLEMRLRHKPAMRNRKKPGEKPIYYYAVYKLKNGGQGMFVMTYEDVLDHAKQTSKSYKDGYFTGPWRDHFDAMAKKTVLIQLMKYMPMATDSPLARGMATDGATFTGKVDDDGQPDFSFAIDADYEELPDVHEDAPALPEETEKAA